MNSRAMPYMSCFPLISDEMEFFKLILYYSYNLGQEIPFLNLAKQTDKILFCHHLHGICFVFSSFILCLL